MEGDNRPQEFEHDPFGDGLELSFDDEVRVPKPVPLAEVVSLEEYRKAKDGIPPRAA